MRVLHFFLLVLACAASSANAAFTVTLHEQAVQNGVQAKLDDVASIEGDAAQVLRRIALPVKGRVGDTVIYTRAEIQRVIAATHPRLAAQTMVTGATRVQVSRRGQPVDESEYIGWAREALTAAELARGPAQIRVQGNYRPLALPVGARAVTTRLDRDPTRSRVKVWLDITVDGVFYAAVPVAFAVSRYEPALVLLQNGEARTHLQTAMVALREIDVSAAASPPLRTPGDIEGKRLRHDLPAGAPLRQSDVEDRPAVERGAELMVSATVGAIAVQTRAVALADGFIGQRIAARTVKNQESLIVDVIGNDRAIVSGQQVGLGER